MPTQAEAIKAFLTAKTRSDLALLYGRHMECQVNVLQDGGTRIESEYQGRKWHGWTDGLQTWKPFRIPYNASGDPTYSDKEMGFDLSLHADGIGMTGWDWEHKRSIFVAFDFDSIINHGDKALSITQLEDVRQAATAIPWVTSRRSTSGSGLHLYVFIDPSLELEISNHTEHAALARSILGRMSAISGFDFSSKVDICGGNMWVWHRKMAGTEGLTLLKAGSLLSEVPVNWRDHLAVTSGKRRRLLPPDSAINNEESFEELAGQCSKVALDNSHKKLIAFLDESSASFWWDQDHHMLVCHTFDLKLAHEQLGLRGVFSTTSQGKDHGHDHNCFCFPMLSGAWTVRRFSPGIAESATWDQDGKGWTRTFLNRDPDLKMAARMYNGVEEEGEKYTFTKLTDAKAVVELLGASVDTPDSLDNHLATIKTHKDGKRIIVSIHREQKDDNTSLPGWSTTKKGYWSRIFDCRINPTQDVDSATYDDILRHLVDVQGADCGWCILSNDAWHDEPLSHIKPALESLQLKANDVKSIIGGCIFKPWALVNQPFQPEYPGDRSWNRHAAQLRYTPSNSDTLSFKAWSKVLSHVGRSLDTVVKSDPWCMDNGLITGADYLKCWIASVFQHPYEPLPYLFLFGPQTSGKSILHEALSLLLTVGYVRADNALISQQGFNGELENGILCVVEETDLGKNKLAYNRIKDWVTSRQLPIRRMYNTPYHVNNTTHWIQCANDRKACPVSFGDTRITMLMVDSIPPSEMVAKRDLMVLLEKEAPDFLAEIMKLELPTNNDRLNLPVLETCDKASAVSDTLNNFELFLNEECYYCVGEAVPFSTLYDKFYDWLDASDRWEWTKIKVGRSLPTKYPKGRYKDSNFHVGNITFDSTIKPSKTLLTAKGEKLVHEVVN